MSTDDYIVQDDQFFIQDDIDWEDPDVIADVFNQTDTRLDKIVNKLEYLLFGNPMILFSKLFIVFFAIFLAGHLARWIM
jgi:hypothetical protein|tara:strand:- start:127 stop:363 length:237 start_codon:yes stop_codon:yes gene_type:complete